MAQKANNIDPQVIEMLLKDYKNPEDLLGETGILKQVKAALCERALSRELTTHLGYEKHDSSGKNSGNSRNGSRSKTLQCEDGDITFLRSTTLRQL